MRRLILATALLLAAVQTGQASLETNCYFAGGYFGSTYYTADYFDETCSAGGGSSPPIDSPGVSLDGVSIGF